MRRALLILGIAGVVASSWTAAALASCAQAPPLRDAIDEAPVAFVGTVVETNGSGRWATVEVAEAWKGEVDDTVEVRGGPADGPPGHAVSSSVDRSFEEGKTYLFLPYEKKGDVYLDNICSSTTGYSERLDALRPEAPAETSDRAPEPTAGERSAVVWWSVAAVAAFGAVVAAAAARLRFRS